MPVFPGDPQPLLDQVASIDKDSFNDHKLTTVMHIGTHIDAPFHMIASGKTIDQFPPEKFFGPGVLVDVRGKQKIDASGLESIDIQTGSVVLFFTGFGEKYRSKQYFENCPELTVDGANTLVRLGVKMVGMDMLGPDLDQPWKIHKILLGNEILILENLVNLGQLLDVGNFEVMAFPPKLQADASPVRVIARFNL